jgi:hypothetical protein
MSSQPKGANAELNQARREQLLLRSEMLNGSSGKISGLSRAPKEGKSKPQPLAMLASWLL